MSAKDKAKNKAEELKGRTKRTAGAAKNDPKLELRGRIEEATGNLKQAGEKLKDAVRRPR